MGRWLLFFPCVGLLGCLFGGGGPPLEQVSDRDVLEFANRIESFYRSLELVPIDTQLTYEDAELRGHFRDGDAFADYYASIANQIRGAAFRNGRADRVEILEFSFDTPEQATVQVALVGRHQRALRFWEIQLARTDTWLLVDGSWLLSPSGL